MKRFISIIILWLVPFAIYAAKLGTLPGIYTPKSLVIVKGKLCISDKNKIHVYDLPGLKKTKTFLEKGGGPKEFTTTPILETDGDKLLVFNALKLAWFSTSGELILEKRLPVMAMLAGHVGDNYILYTYDFTAKQKSSAYMISIALYNQALEKLKVISLTDKLFRKKSGGKLVRPLVVPLLKFSSYGRKIYLVERRKDFHIDVFDDRGNPVGAVHREYKPIKISEEYKTRRLEEHKNNPVIKKKWHIAKKIFKYTFPDYFPAIQDFLVADDRIYVKTYLEKNSKEEYWILNLDGKLIKKVLLPHAVNGYWRFYKGHFYYIFENDNEEWECHRIKI